MAVDDLYRRIYSSRAIGRVLSGHDQFEKEALEGHAAGQLAATRRARMAGPQAPGVEAPNSFAAALKRRAEEKAAEKKDKKK